MAPQAGMSEWRSPMTRAQPVSARLDAEWAARSCGYAPRPSTRVSARFSAVAVSSAWPRRSGATLQFVPVEFCEFLAGQPFVVVASQDQRGRVWASLVVGGPGFARSLDDRRVLLAGAPAPGGPLSAALQRPGARVGVLAIEFDTRIRIRLNG